MNVITSTKNPLIKAARDLSRKAERDKTGLFLVEGEVMIREALNCGLTLTELFAVEKRADFAESVFPRATLVSANVMEVVCDTKTPQGVCGIFRMPEPLQTSALPERVVALDGVQDPGNVGTIWRTADAAGFQALLLGAGCADPMSPKVQRSAMGSGFRVPISLTDDLAETLGDLARKGYTIVCSDLKGDDFYSRPDEGKKFVLVIGNEARGISDAVRETATMRVRLPMRGGAESLNAAVAAGILMYELMRGKD